VRICPNYFLTARAVHDLQRNLYSAHEISQMVPLSGGQYYQELRRLNGWVSMYLPNASGPPKVVYHEKTHASRVQNASEFPQRTRLGDALENWEMNRKIRRFASHANAESQFTSDQCKGHFELHGEKASNSLRSRLLALESLL
jgi:hypothetical protein